MRTRFHKVWSVQDRKGQNSSAFFRNPLGAQQMCLLPKWNDTFYMVPFPNFVLMCFISWSMNDRPTIQKTKQQHLIYKKAPKWQNKNQECCIFVMLFCGAFFCCGNNVIIWQRKTSQGLRRSSCWGFTLKFRSGAYGTNKKHSTETATCPDPPPLLHHTGRSCTCISGGKQHKIITRVGTPQTHFHCSWSHISFTANQTLSKCI